MAMMLTLGSAIIYIGLVLAEKVTKKQESKPTKIEQYLAVKEA